MDGQVFSEKETQLKESMLSEEHKELIDSVFGKGSVDQKNQDGFKKKKSEQLDKINKKFSNNQSQVQKQADNLQDSRRSPSDLQK